MSDASDLTHCVNQWKQVLEDRSGSASVVCNALDKLRGLGALPTKVLQDTKIGVAVNHLSKDAGAEERVRKAAKALLADWKEMHRKRKCPDPEQTAVLKQAKQTEEKAEAGAAGRSVQREKVLQMLRSALAARDVSAPKSEALAEAIEGALHLQLGSDKAYTNQSRTILYNLKDASNTAFRQKLLDGVLDPSELPRMGSEEMASDSKAASRAELRQQALQQSAVKAPEEQITDMYTCERCKGKQCTYVTVTPTSCVNGEHSWTSVTCLLCNNRWKT